METSEAVIADTSILVAALDRRERWHGWVLEQMRGLHEPLYVCEAVMTEVCFLASGHALALGELAAWLEAGFLRFGYDAEGMTARTFQLMNTYRNVPMSYADACIICMVEKLPRARVFTLDMDFQIYRQRNRRVIPLIAPFG